jgi:hypothetical protein
VGNIDIDSAGRVGPGDKPVLLLNVLTKNSDGTDPNRRSVASLQYRWNIDIGGRIGGFDSWTRKYPVVLAPSFFSFKAQSETVTISGDINWKPPVTVTGGEYSVNCVDGQFTSAPGTVIYGNTICVRHMSSSDNGQSVNTKLVIGGVEGTFTSTTVTAPSAPPSNNAGGSSGGGGALN